MNRDFDVIVVGARVAGSILSAVLGRKGYKILLLDRARFPSDTLSTHFFRYPTFHVLNSLGILGQVHACAPKLVNNFNVIDGHVFTEPVAGPDGPSYFLCVRRITLDEILADRVRKEISVVLHENARVENLLYQNDRVVGVQWSEAKKSFECDGACGCRSRRSQFTCCQARQACARKIRADSQGYVLRLLFCLHAAVGTGG